MVCVKHPSAEQNCTVCELEKEVLELQDTLSKVYGMLLTARTAYGNCDDFTVNYKINEAIVTIEEHKEG